MKPTAAPEHVSEVAASRGWRWTEAAESSDREHPASYVSWELEKGSGLELRLHQFGFWFIDILDSDDDVERAILAEFDVQDEDELVGRTEHPDDSVRADAVHQLGILAAVEQSEPVVDAIGRALADESLEVRTHALEAACVSARLTGLRDAVQERVEAETDPDVRDYAAVLFESL